MSAEKVSKCLFIDISNHGIRNGLLDPSLENLRYNITGVSILTSYGENPHYVKLPIFTEFMENSTKFMKNSDLTKWTQNLR